jgi:crossover junction endodeoxyribonuclease RusA
MTELVFPWPPRALSPNARLHWGQVAQTKAAYLHDCWVITKESGIKVPDTLGLGSLHLWLTFYPPDRRHRDDDNMIAAFKAGRDGLARALGINDKRFVTHPFVSDEIGGIVKVRISLGPEQPELGGEL